MNIIRHILCALRRPGNARWHLAGIRRELALALALVATLLVLPVTVAALIVTLSQ